MNYAIRLDLRDIATEWRDHLLEVQETEQEIDPADARFSSKYHELCDDLGLDYSPDELEDYVNSNGPTMVLERDFSDYAREFCEETGSLPDDLSELIRTNIDWDGVADDIRPDYTEATYDGNLYLVEAH